MQVFSKRSSHHAIFLYRRKNENAVQKGHVVAINTNGNLMEQHSGNRAGGVRYSIQDFLHRFGDMRSSVIIRNNLVMSLSVLRAFMSTRFKLSNCCRYR